MGEASPSGSAEPGGGAPGGLQRIAGTRSAFVALGVAGVAALGVVVATVVLVSGPRPVETLQLVESEADLEILAILAGEEQWAAIDPSTLRGYEPWGAIEVWSATNDFGSPCLIAFERETRDVVSTSCVPEPADLFIDVMGFGLPDGGRTRFIGAGDTLAVHVYLPEGAD